MKMLPAGQKPLKKCLFCRNTDQGREIPKKNSNFYIKIDDSSRIHLLKGMYTQTHQKTAFKVVEKTLHLIHKRSSSVFHAFARFTTVRYVFVVRNIYRSWQNFESRYIFFHVLKFILRSEMRTFTSIF